MAIHLYKNDLPDGFDLTGDLAIDSETLGLNPHRDRLCVVQLSTGDGDAHLVQFDGKDYSAPNLKALLNDTSRAKIFHFARFDVAVIKAYLDVDVTPVFCTKICLLYTSPSPRDLSTSRMPSSA